MSNLLAAGGGTNLDADYSVAFFWILAVLAGGGAVGLVLLRQAVHCALMLAVVMLSLSAMYAMQGAPFLAFVQVIVYTGAVLMLFLFVMMLIGSHSKDSLAETLRAQWLWGLLAGGGLATMLIIGIGHAAIGSAPKPSAAFGNDNLTGLAKLIFTTYVYPFEITSALLITAALGAMVLAHRERTSPKPTQRDIARQRVRSGHVMPEPPPGVYALHDATDIPALLPDGSAAERSVSATLVQRDLDFSRNAKELVREDLAAEAKAEGHEIEAGSHGGEA